MNTPTLLWLAAMAFLAGVVAAAAYLLLKPAGSKAPEPLPADWPLTARGVFNADERRAYRVLRDALPHQVILSKLPLVRFCQPIDSASTRYWYELLGSTHVAFAICSGNGRVLAAINLDAGRAMSRRAVQIKQAVLAACRVRYLRCRADALPTVAELQLLVPHHDSAGRAPQGPITASADLEEARDSLSNAVAARRAERNTLWQDSSFFQESFFDSTPDRGAPDDIVGIVTDHPRNAGRELRQHASG